jgi:FHA domain
MAAVIWYCPVCPDDTPAGPVRGNCAAHRVPLIARSEQAEERPAATPVPAARAVASSAPRMALRIAGGRVEVPADGLLLGRSLPPLLGLPEMAALTQVSRTTQARMYWEASVLYVVDAGSTNGTFVDDVSADHPLPLVPGARLRFGEDVLVDVVQLDEHGMVVANASGT